MRRRGLSWIAAGTLLVALALAFGCTPQPAPVTAADRIWQTYGDALAIAVDTYTEAMRSAGAAHARGLITDAQLEQVRVTGNQVKAALDVAKAALVVYSTAQDPAPQAIALAVSSAQQALLGLLQQLAELGVTP